MCVEGCLWVLCSQRDGLHRPLSYCLSIPSPPFQTRFCDGTQAGTSHRLRQLTPCEFPPITEPERSWKAGTGRMDSLCLFARFSCPRPSINRSTPAGAAHTSYPVFYAMSLIKGPLKHISTSQPAPLSRSLSPAPCNVFFKLLGSDKSSLPPVFCQLQDRRLLLQLLYPCFPFIFSVLQFMWS